VKLTMHGNRKLGSVRRSAWGSGGTGPRTVEEPGKRPNVSAGPERMMYRDDDSMHSCCA
jgi:hypothetical protein